MSRFFCNQVSIRSRPFKHRELPLLFCSDHRRLAILPLFLVLGPPPPVFMLLLMPISSVFLLNREGHTREFFFGYRVPIYLPLLWLESFFFFVLSSFPPLTSFKVSSLVLKPTQMDVRLGLYAGGFSSDGAFPFDIPAGGPSPLLVPGTTCSIFFRERPFDATPLWGVVLALPGPLTFLPSLPRDETFTSLYGIPRAGYASYFL